MSRTVFKNVSKISCTFNLHSTNILPDLSYECYVNSPEAERKNKITVTTFQMNNPSFTHDFLLVEDGELYKVIHFDNPVDCEYEERLAFSKIPRSEEGWEALSQAFEKGEHDFSEGVYYKEGELSCRNR